MSTDAPSQPEAAARPAPSLGVLCLGEALVDLICERPVEDLADADVFVPHFGGAVANIAVVAARAGARVSLAGGVGDDAWGRWLARTLEQAGVGLSLFEALPGSSTPMAVVTVDLAGEAHYTIYGETIGNAVRTLGAKLERAVTESAALFISSNTLVSEDERELTMRAREAALSLERPVIFDPNLRLHRWSSKADAAASANACVPGALLVRCNAAEAALMTGEDEVERAATAILKAGAQMVVITLGHEGAILRGAFRADVDGLPAQVISTIGAGDAVTGTLLARLALSDFYPPSVPAALRDAVAEAALACERWGAVD